MAFFMLLGGIGIVWSGGWRGREDAVDSWEEEGRES